MTNPVRIGAVIALWVIVCLLQCSRAHIGEPPSSSDSHQEDEASHSTKDDGPGITAYSLAFGLTCGSGLFTAVGGAAIFLHGDPGTNTVKHRQALSSQFFAVGIGATAGALTYGALAKLVPEAQYYLRRGVDKASAEFALLGFMAVGIAVIALLNWGAQRIRHRHMKPKRKVVRQNLEFSLQGISNGPAKPALGDLSSEIVGKESDEEADKEETMRQAWISAMIAIIMHNIPEGVVTFAGTLANPILGISLAFAIAVHNIPEGLAIALPVFYTTKSRWRAFLFAAVSGGLAEPLGALIGYAIVSGGVATTGFTFGALFAGSVGMMMYLVVNSMLPLAYAFDVDHTIISSAFFSGVAVMGLSFAIALI